MFKLISYPAFGYSKEEFHWLGIKKNISITQSDLGSWQTDGRSGRQTDDQIYLFFFLSYPSGFHVHAAANTVLRYLMIS